MYLIVGLGNPTLKYEHTRHNVGFDTVDALAEKYGIEICRRKCMALYGKGVIEGQQVLLAKPQTYMNQSGSSVQQLLDWFGLLPEENLIVVFDDISLAPGNIRVRKKGSAGGHNGIKDIIAMTGTQQFARVKVGVGEKPVGWELADHVLSRFGQEERLLVDAAIEDALGAIVLMVQGKTDEAMNRYNAKKTIESGTGGESTAKKTAESGTAGET